MEKRARSRACSTWKNITILDDDGVPVKVFPLDNLGQLIDKMPRQRRRNLRNKVQVDSPPVVLEQQSLSPVVPALNPVENVNKVTSSSINTVTDPLDLSLEACGLGFAGDSDLYNPNDISCDLGFDLWDIASFV